MKKGDQLFLRYGSHSNAFLFSEYGFVLPKPAGDGEEGEDFQNYGQVLVDDIVFEMFERKGKPWMRDALQKWDYWGYVLAFASYS